MESGDVRKLVRQKYGAIARGGGKCCSGGCAEAVPDVREAGRAAGYSEEQLVGVPDGANLGLGCGNPTALAALKEGETLLDLGSGAGFDCFLAAARVGDAGRVIGVDMTPDMVEKARANAAKAGAANVEFRLGEIERLPVADCSVDVVISNCVINLSPDKPAVFREAWRVMRPGGRLMVSDMVLLAPLPRAVRESMEAYIGCIAGAIALDDYLAAMREAGFGSPEVVSNSTELARGWAEAFLTREVLKKMDVSREEALAYADAVSSVSIIARKQAAG